MYRLDCTDIFIKIVFKHRLIVLHGCRVVHSNDPIAYQSLFMYLEDPSIYQDKTQMRQCILCITDIAFKKFLDKMALKVFCHTVLYMNICRKLLHQLISLQWALQSVCLLYFITLLAICCRSYCYQVSLVRIYIVLCYECL